jgi:hypothetical protein
LWLEVDEPCLNVVIARESGRCRKNKILDGLLDAPPSRGMTEQGEAVSITTNVF